MSEIKKIISKIDSSISTKKKKYSNYPNMIHCIRFPVYKNMEEDTRIRFEYPLTVFVGQNGCGKSSVLHAICGTTNKFSVGNFWFSTKLDPIKEGRGKPNCFIFQYYNKDANKLVEVIKTRSSFDKTIKGKRVRKPDFWEPRRPSVEYGMARPEVLNGVPEAGAHHTRWKVPRFNIKYLDFRSELSAFDQYVYFGRDPKNLKSYDSKQDRLRAWIKNRLEPIFKGKIFEFKVGGKALNKKIIQLKPSELSKISDILGKQYTGCKILEHKIFDGSNGYSVQFQTESRTYSEAFAGSGEMAVVRVVQSVIGAPKNSLILLDEPEVSLHPGAQRKLRDFLLEQVLSRGHQVVICSHSPVFLEDLPERAIKVFVPGKNETYRVVDNVSRNDAFIQIGKIIENKKLILVEDSAAKSLLESVLENLGSNYVNAISVEYYPGGETSIFKDLVVHARQETENIYVVFDGDVYQEEWPEIGGVADIDIDQEIEKYTGQDIKSLSFRFDGGQDVDQERKSKEIKKTYLSYISERCRYLPADTPEEIIWAASDIAEKNTFEIDVTQEPKGRYKEIIGNYVLDQTGGDSNSDRNTIIKQILKKKINFGNEYMLQIRVILEEIHNR